jgi:GNAT superfamily N-acetyltransferase
MQLTVRQATRVDTQLISDILLEAARWLRSERVPMWRDDELLPERLIEDVSAGLFFVGEIAGEVIATIRFQCTDPAFWPDVPADESAFVHRIAVRRRFAGRGVSAALLSWAAERAQALGRRYLRLDCEASRPRLRAVYERFGFRHHSDRQVGPYFVSRYELPVFPANQPNRSLEPTAGPV